MANTLLLLETATEVCSVGISREGENLVIKEAAAEYDHAGQITLLIRACLDELSLTVNDLAGVVVSSGPGSYTSLRVGAATAKGICYAAGLPLLVVDTLQALALAGRRPEDRETDVYIPMIDARRMEVYAAVYAADGSNLEVTQAIIVSATSWQPYRQAPRRLILSGNGAEKCRPILGEEGIIYRPEVRCSAAHLVGPAWVLWQQRAFTDAAYYRPYYFKPPNVTTPRARR